MYNCKMILKGMAKRFLLFKLHKFLISNLYNFTFLIVVLDLYVHLVHNHPSKLTIHILIFACTTFVQIHMWLVPYLVG